MRVEIPVQEVNSYIRIEVDIDNPSVYLAELTVNNFETGDSTKVNVDLSQMWNLIEASKTIRANLANNPNRVVK